MEAEEAKKWLRIPLYKLNYIDDVDSYAGLNDAELAGFQKDYSADQRAHIIEALQWARNNPSFDFKSLLPHLRPSNDSIYRYLRLVLRQLTPMP